MVDQTERLTLQMSADLSRLTKSVEAGQRRFDQQLLKMERRAQQADKNLSRIMSNAGRNMVGGLQSSLSSLAPTLAAAFSATQVIKYADSYTSLQNRLKAAGLEGERLIEVENALFAAANRNGIEVDAVTQLFQRASLSRKALGATDQQLIALTNGVTAALRVQGVSAQAASGPLLQLGQALGGGTVRAEELNSLIEGTPIILEAAAKGSSKFSGDVAKLSAAIRDGELSSKSFFSALLTGLPAIEAQAAELPLTVGQSLQILDNQLGRFVGQTDASLSASQRMAAGIAALANNLDTAVQVVAVLTALIGTRYVLALTAGSGALIAQTVATARLTAFQTAMTASMTGTTRATLLATAATRTFTGSLAANPIGVAIVAVLALTAAFASLKGSNDRANDAIENSNELLARTGSNAAASVAGVRQLSSATQDLTGSTLRLADAKLQAERAERLLQITENRKVIQDLRNPSFLRRAAEIGSIGTPLLSGRLQQQREAQAAQLEAANVRLLRDQIGVTFAPGTRFSTGDVGGGSSTESKDAKGGGRGRSGPTPEELAAQREMLRLQGELELLRAQGNERAATAKQREIDLINLTKQYQDAGFEDAAKLAKIQVEAVAKAEDAAASFAALQERATKGAEAFAESVEKETEEARRRNDVLLDRLSLEAELARLSGDPKRIEQAERSLYIEQRINDLLAQRTGLITDADRVAARRQAEGEYLDLGDADRQGQLREEFRQSFSEGIRAAIDGDLGGFFESMADRFTDRMLDNLADDLFDLLSEAAKGFGGSGGGGGGWASAIASLFSGKRAMGGPVTAGRRYIVGEKRPEVFVPNVNGTILPRVDAAVAKGRQGRGAQVVDFRQTINLAGANGDETIRRIAYDAASQGGLAAYRQARADVPADLAKRRKYGTR